MKLCKDCRYETTLSGKPYRICKKLTPEAELQEPWSARAVICINARSSDGECGPNGKHWDQK